MVGKGVEWTHSQLAWGRARKYIFQSSPTFSSKEVWFILKIYRAYQLTKSDQPFTFWFTTEQIKRPKTYA